MKNLQEKQMDKVISVYWFTVLFIVAGAIVYMVGAFYGSPYDVRDYESQILISHVAECLTPDNYLATKFISSDYNKGDFLDDCRINFGTEEDYGWNVEGQHFLNLKISDFNSDAVFFEGEFGNLNLKDLCIIQKQTVGEKLPVCLERKFYSVDSENKQYLITIGVAVDKNEKNVN